MFSKDWAKAHGSPLEDDQQNDGHRFQDDDFTCDVGFGFNPKVFKARIKSIRKHIAKVVDEKGEESTIYFGGCSRIELASGKAVPQAGDEIYIKGSNKWGGNANEYNVHQCTCSCA